MTALFSPEWLEREAKRRPALVKPAPKWRVQRRKWRQTTMAFIAPSLSPRVPRAALATKASRKAVKANPLILAKAEGKRLGLYAKDNWAEVVIVVPPTRDAGERDARQIRNEPDCLGRVAFTSTGFGKRRDTFENLTTWLGHLEAMGRKWRMG